MKTRNRQPASILFDEIYIVGILVLTWALFRLIAIYFLALFDNACVPSSMIAFGTDYIGVFWLVVAADTFALAWIALYVVNALRTARFRYARLSFVAVVLVFVIGNLSTLPTLFEWREVERDPRASFNLLHADRIQEWNVEFGQDYELPGELVSSQWESCTPMDELEFKRDVWEARYEERFGFWMQYEERTSRGMQDALYVVNERLLESSEDGEAWAMRALVYGNAVDYGVAPSYEAIPAARNSLDYALKYAPEANATRAAYGLLMRTKDTAGAEARLERCVADADIPAHWRPRSDEHAFAECHNLYGDLLRKTGRAEQAGDIYLEGLKRWPENGELHVSYALYLQETGRASEAIEYLREFVAEQSRFPRGHWHLAVMLYEEGAIWMKRGSML